MDSAATPSTFHRRQPAEDLPGLTGLRGVAAVVVMLSHFGIGNIAPPFRAMLWHNAAVDLFFVLSSFTLLHVYDSAEPLDWRRFLIRRVARIYPLYAVLFVIFAIHNLPHYQYERSHYLPDAIRQALLVNCWPLIGNDIAWIVPSWSLSVEWLAYLLLFPLLLRLDGAVGATLRRWPVLGLALSLGASGLAFEIYSHYFRWTDISIHFTRITLLHQVAPAARGVMGFLSGYALFTCDRALRRRIATRDRTLARLAWVTLAACAVVLGLGAAWIVPIDLMIVMGPLLVLCCAASGNVLSRWLATPVMLTLGALSYAIYLVHFPVMIFAQDLMGYWMARPDLWFIDHPAIMVPGLTLVSLPLAALLHWCLERPAQRWIRRLESQPLRLPLPLPRG